MLRADDGPEAISSGPGADGFVMGIDGSRSAGLCTRNSRTESCTLANLSNSLDMLPLPFFVGLI